MTRRLVTCLILLTAFCAGNSALPAAEPVAKLPPPADRAIDFVEDIRPIFAASCLKCHGPEKQEGGYRLDVKQTALTGGDNFAPNIVAKKSAESPLIRFVAGLEDGMQMPAKGPPLSAEQIGLLRAWIDQGANWPDAASAKIVNKLDWWSLKPLNQVSPPAGQKSATGNVIDAFVRARLAKENLSPAPPAERRTLIRRLAFDLIGLPPTPEEVDEFVRSTNPLAYEKLVDRWLASPAYGERWARHWIDTAHFAETHGHDQDRIRENAWPYRDYLIRSLNADKPYGRFVQEQIAGDALFPDDSDATVALGFLAAGPWDESSLRDIREDTLDRQIGRYLDRDDMLATVMNNIVAATVQCARCHDHKFDPISQADYYSLQAVFAGVERANRAYDADPNILARRRELLVEQKRLDSKSEGVLSELRSEIVQRQVAQWEASLKSKPAAWKVLTPATATSSDGQTLTRQDDGSLVASGTRPERNTYTISATVPLTEITAVRLEVLTHPDLPHQGPGRQDNGNLHLSEIEVRLGDASGKLIPIARAVADFDQQDWGISLAIDGNPQTAWGIFPQVGKSHEAVFELKEKLALPPDTRFTVILKQLHGAGHLIGRPRLSVTAAPLPVVISKLPPAISEILALDTERRSGEQRDALALYHRQQTISAELSALPKPSFIYAAASQFEPDGSLKPPPGPRPIHLLRRGDIRFPGAEASPGALSCIAGLPPRFELRELRNEAERRAALARWLTDRNNPLTWRVIVNRVWHHHFGRGLVATPNDFGRMGAQPSHPELLDYLAVWFRDNGQSLKALHRLIVTSDTYRQSSRSSVALVEGKSIARSDRAVAVDAENQLLWRMNRTRLDAECVRDAVLAISGQLDRRMGGPSDRQFDLKPGRHVTPIIDYAKFDLASPAGQRRSVYRFLFRTLPDPFMEALDCPAGDQITPARTNTVTVQQALAMWNDAFVLHHCQHLAQRLETSASDTAGRVGIAFRLALGRAASEKELSQFTAYAEQHGLANFCRLLLNLNEFVFLE